MATERPDRRDWTRHEVEATVADYFAMFMAELSGKAYNKAAHNRTLRTVLDRRSRVAVERKHQNISAVLLANDLPYVPGYKPLPHAQGLLKEVVTDWIARPEFVMILEADLTRQAEVPTVDDILAALVDAPDRRKRSAPDRVREQLPTYTRRPNYLLREALNSQLGRAGEEFVINYERARLVSLGQPRLAESVEHVSVTRGDFEGFDVLSFGGRGEKRLIEVKTTKSGADSPFYVTPNEFVRSRDDADRYHVYRLFAFRQRPKLFTLSGAFDQTCELDPASYIARVS